MEKKDLVEYFIARTDKRFDELGAKVDKLTEFKAFLLGSSFAISAITSTIIGLATVYFMSK